MSDPTTPPEPLATTPPATPVARPATPPWRNPVALGIAAVVVIAAIVIAIVAGTSSNKPSHSTLPPSTGHGVLVDAVANVGRSSSVTFTLSVGANATSVNATGGCAFRPTACTLNVGFTGISSPQLANFNPISALVVDNTIYVKLPSTYATILGKTWVSIPLGSSFVKGLEQKNKVHTSQLPGVFTAMEHDVHVAQTGSSTVAGVAVTDYKVTTNVNALQAQLEQQFPQLAKGSSGGTVPNPTITFAVDAQNRLRQFNFDITTTGAKPEHVTVVLTVTGYDVPVTASAPASSDTVPFSELSRLGSSGT